MTRITASQDAVIESIQQLVKVELREAPKDQRFEKVIRAYAAR